MTVYQAASIRLGHVLREIERLQEQARILRARMGKYRASTMGEAERVATEAERFQTVPFPSYPCCDDPTCSLCAGTGVTDGTGPAY